MVFFRLNLGRSRLLKSDALGVDLVLPLIFGRPTSHLDQQHLMQCLAKLLSDSGLWLENPKMERLLLGDFWFKVGSHYLDLLI